MKNKTIYLTWCFCGLNLYTSFCDTKYIEEYNKHNKYYMDAHLDTFFDMIKAHISEESSNITYDLSSF
jgi:hypothetical protein